MKFITIACLYLFFVFFVLFVWPAFRSGAQKDETPRSHEDVPSHLYVWGVDELSDEAAFAMMEGQAWEEFVDKCEELRRAAEDDGFSLEEVKAAHREAWIAYQKRVRSFFS